MKLKAPKSVGDPCVAGVGIVPRDGVYEVEPEIGALLIECFGFVEANAPVKPSGPKQNAPKPIAATASSARRGRAPSRKA